MTKKYTCEKCGSESIRKDAAAVWDGHNWVLLTHYDHAYCDECGWTTNTLTPKEDSDNVKQR